MVASVPWAEPGSRFTRDFEAECAWLMTVANRKTVSGFLHVSWRTAGAVARRVAERVKASMPSPFDGLTAIGVDGTSYRKGHTYLAVVVDHERHVERDAGREAARRDRRGSAGHDAAGDTVDPAHGARARHQPPRTAAAGLDWRLAG